MITDNRCLDYCRKPNVHLGQQAFQNHLKLELGRVSASILLGHDIFS